MRVKARWSGFSGGPGYTVLHFRDFDGPDGGEGSVNDGSVNGALDKAYLFFDALRPQLPAEVRIQVEAEVDIIEDSNGELVRSVAGTTPLLVAGSGAGSYSAAVGAVVNWRTGGVRNGRRVRGRSFLVPLAGGAFGTNGALVPSVQALIQTAADTLASSTGTPDLFVYARPSNAAAVDGRAFAVTSASVPSLGAVLRSRRD